MLDSSGYRLVVVSSGDVSTGCDNGPMPLLPMDRVMARRDGPEKNGMRGSGGGND